MNRKMGGLREGMDEMKLEMKGMSSKLDAFLAIFQEPGTYALENHNLHSVEPIQSSSNRVLLVDGDNGSKSDGCPNTENIAYIAPQSGAMATNSIIKYTTSGATKQDGSLEQRTPHAFGQTSVNTKNASDLQTGPVACGFGCGIEAMPSRESQVSVGAMVSEAVKAQPCHEETEACTKNKREEGELSCGGKLDKKSFTAFGSTSTKVSETPSKSVARAKEIKGEIMCTEKAEGEADANAEDEEMCTHGSSDCENVSGTYGYVFHGKWKGSGVAIQLLHFFEQVIRGKGMNDPRDKFEFKDKNAKDSVWPFTIENVIAFWKYIGPFEKNIHGVITAASISRFIVAIAMANTSFQVD